MKPIRLGNTINPDYIHIYAEEYRRDEKQLEINWRWIMLNVGVKRKCLR